MSTTRVRGLRRLAALGAVALVALAACGNDAAGSGGGSGGGSGNGNGGGNGATSVDDGTTRVDPTDVATQIDSIPLATLTEEEVAGLVWMREEEKLARDVYTTLGEQYDLRIFTTSRREQTRSWIRCGAGALRHRRPGREAVGDFTDPVLQATISYADGASRWWSLSVGAEIEELDIVDSDRHRGGRHRPRYSNLERGSATICGVARSWPTTTPPHAHPSQPGRHDAIVSGDMEQGAGG